MTCHNCWQRWHWWGGAIVSPLILVSTGAGLLFSGVAARVELGGDGERLGLEGARSSTDSFFL